MVGVNQSSKCVGLIQNKELEGAKTLGLVRFTLEQLFFTSLKVVDGTNGTTLLRHSTHTPDAAERAAEKCP